jgi:hypothetical protein
LIKSAEQRISRSAETQAPHQNVLDANWHSIGYARDAVAKVVFHPDRRVYEAIQLVFTKFRELWSVRQTFQWFRDHDVERPANPIQGTGLVWKIPSQSLIRGILCNPFYAGAYVWARRPVTTLLVDGRLEKRQSVMHGLAESWNGRRKWRERSNCQVCAADRPRSLAFRKEWEILEVRGRYREAWRRVSDQEFKGGRLVLTGRQPGERCMIET